MDYVRVQVGTKSKRYLPILVMCFSLDLPLICRPVTQKTYHSKSSSFDKARKLDKEEANRVRENSGNCWVRDARTGIYYPKGQEKVMDGIPATSGKDTSGVHWFSYNDHSHI